MKNNNNFENLFEELQGQFDIEEPNQGHEARFLDKLEASAEKDNNVTTTNFWKPFLSIAASIIICLGTFHFINQDEKNMDLASVSPEMSQAQDIFTATINEELKKLDAERSPLTEQIIYEAERQLKALEADYSKLKTNLKESGNDKRVIYAMIANFQSRIDILTTILEKIEDLKNTNYETNNTL